MYYKSINRGLSFTKPGFYAVGYVMMVGLLAIVSGVNGLYLFLSSGLALLIVSGLLSEKVMRFSRVLELSRITADSNTPFTVEFSVQNRSPNFTIYGVDSYFLFSRPRVKFIGADIPAPIKGTALRIEPGATVVSRAECSGIARGWYQKIVVFQKTSYPFGFLEKYRFGEVACDLVITPKVNESLLAKLCKEILAYKIERDQVQDFYSHRNYNAKDSLRLVDWKKSANRSQKDWVVRQYKAEHQTHQARVKLDIGLLKAVESEAIYESLLSNTRTCLLAFFQNGFETTLDVSDYRESAFDKQLLFLAALPSFPDRKKIDHYLLSQETKSDSVAQLVCMVDSSGYKLVVEKRAA